jgi:hypothetical protein
MTNIIFHGEHLFLNSFGNDRVSHVLLVCNIQLTSILLNEIVR